jgi:hypothetical protein
MDYNERGGLLGAAQRAVYRVGVLAVRIAMVIALGVALGAARLVMPRS